MLEHIKSIDKLKEEIKNILGNELSCDMYGRIIEIGQMDMATLNLLHHMNGKLNLCESEIVKLTKEEIMTNPYLSNIKVPNVSLNNFRLSNSRLIHAGLLAKYGFKTMDLTTMEQHNSYFVCDKNLCFPCLSKSNSTTCCMSAEPFEFNSFEPLIEKASGNVLLIGCGIGYAAYMLSRKSDVKSVTIIDSSKDVLELFSNHILPQFEYPEKIRTVNDDGIKYLKENKLDNYDYINVDIWCDVYDMIYPYLECLEIEKENPNVNFSYWLEEELKLSVQKNILAAVSDFEITDFLIGKICDDIVKNVKPHTYKEIYDLVNIENLRNFLYSWYIKNKDIVKEIKEKDMTFIATYQEMSNDLVDGQNGYMKRKMLF